VSLIGVDIGTSTCKAALYSVGGKLMAGASRSYPTLHPAPLWAELDSRLVVSAAIDVVRELGGKAGKEGVTALAFSAMGEAMTPVSADRKILGNAILMADRRGEEEIRDFAARFEADELYSINPNIVSPNYSLPKLLWLRRERPQLYASADRFLLFAELVPYLLGLDPVTSYSHANRTLLFDLRAQAWSDRLCREAGIDPARLPLAAPSGQVLGELGAAAAERLGLDKGTLCVLGTHDQCAAALGSGLWSAGGAACGIGTVECITPVYDGIPDLGAMRSLGFNVEHHAVPGLYVSFIYNQAGSLVNWFRSTFASADRLGSESEAFERLAAEIPSEPTSLLVLPYFEPVGAPKFIQNASGLILGLRTSTSRGEILKAIMECETYFFLESLGPLRELGIDTRRFVASGGGAKSTAWLQIKADVMGLPFERATAPEAGALGAAMIAGLGSGVFASYEEAAERYVGRGEVFEPDSLRHRIYAEKYERYKELYPRLADIL